MASTGPHATIVEGLTIEGPSPRDATGMTAIRVFVSSPSDVGEERALARRLLSEVIPHRPLLRGRLSVEVVSWDGEHGSLPFDAGLSPQATVEQMRGRAADCDLVLVILWSRMGTPVLDVFGGTDGVYASGTEREYLDALQVRRRTGRPALWVYRRTEVPRVALNDPELDERRAQYQAVERFCGRIVADGCGLNPYSMPSEFGTLLLQHLEEWLALRLGPAAAGAASAGGQSLFLATRIGAFCDQHLVSEHCPVPFGGRAAELARLPTTRGRWSTAKAE